MRPFALVLLLSFALAQTHVVAPGETLFAIAKRYGTTVEELARLNGLKDPSRIRAGQVLRVRPVAEMGLPKGRLRYTHPVQGRALGLRVEGYGGGEPSSWRGATLSSARGRGFGAWSRLGPWWNPGPTPLGFFWTGWR
jgi:murein DD-endopeptidase MepM/ murein hydrolase activator NlpD